MKLRPRLIPSVILAATVLLGLKVSDIFSVGSHALAQAPSPNQATGAPIDLMSQANAAIGPSPMAAAAKLQDTSAEKPAPAQQAAAPQQQPAAPQQQGAAPQQQAATSQQAAVVPQQPPAASQQQTAASPSQPAAAQQQTPAPQAPAQRADAATTAAPVDGAKPAQQTADASSAGAPSATAPDTKPAMKDPLLLSPAEIEVLQELSARRAQLDQRAGEIDQQQVVLQAAEKRVDEKIAKLAALQKSIQAAVDKQNAEDDARTQSLVKIYQTMKPADAAQIISQLDLPIVLQIISHMKEAKTAPILAAMDPTKAEAITAAMAQRRNPPAVPPPQTTASAAP